MVNHLRKRETRMADTFLLVKNLCDKREITNFVNHRKQKYLLKNEDK